MAIPLIQAGRDFTRLCQPFSLFKLNRIGRLPEGARSARLSLLVGLLAALALLVSSMATDASAAPARLLTAKFSGGCNQYTITVTGEGLKEPNPIVSYNITLTPPAGEPIAIVDSFPVAPEKDGRFHKTIHGTWKKFEFTLADKYTLSGSAILASNLTLLHTLPIAFWPKNLNCG
jgi:hypothetical protein